MIAKCPFCDEYFGANLLEMHMSLCEKKHKEISSPFICSKCNKVFTDEHAYLKHKKTLHKEVVNDLFKQ